MAATLYCLNRREDAEKHWLRAVKLRPSYLEAAEHLVGLLYKKRSKEAVEVIDFIQGALRVKSPGSSQLRSSTTTYQTVSYSIIHSRNLLLLLLLPQQY
jgi:hypothetical protein